MLRGYDAERHDQLRNGYQPFLQPCTGVIALISFLCPTCRTGINRDETEAGTKIACPSCGQRLLIPQPPALPSPAPQPVQKTVLGLLQPAASNPTVLGVLRPSHQAPASLNQRVTTPDAQAILVALQQDKHLAETTMGPGGPNAKPSEVAASIDAYCTQAEKLDLSSCPADFTVAYRQHIRAWRATQQAFAQIPDDFWKGLFVGVINILHGEGDGGKARMQATLRQAQEKVQATWEEVEKIGAKYGAAL
jgi:DNA-directed RNA polymerase subunit RPC12/RpoP